MDMHKKTLRLGGILLLLITVLAAAALSGCGGGKGAGGDGGGSSPPGWTRLALDDGVINTPGEIGRAHV